jgi:hypothetical protein
MSRVFFLNVCLWVSYAVANGPETPTQPKLHSEFNVDKKIIPGQSSIIPQSNLHNNVVYPVRRSQLKLLSERHEDRNCTGRDIHLRPYRSKNFGRCGEECEAYGVGQGDISKIEYTPALPGSAEMGVTSRESLTCHDSQANESIRLMRANVDAMMDRLLSIKRLRSDIERVE